MRWELLLAAGSTVGALVLGFLYARALVGASKAKQYLLIAETLKTALSATRGVVAHKEEYIRELEKTVLGNLPASKLVERLNLLFAANRSRTAGSLPTPK